MTDHSDARYYWHDDFELDESTDAIPGKYLLAIYEGPVDELNEVAVIVHRASDRWPINGAEADQKRARAGYMVDALNMKRRCDSGEWSVKDNETGEWIA